MRLEKKASVPMSTMRYARPANARASAGPFPLRRLQMSTLMVPVAKLAGMSRKVGWSM